MNSKIKLMLIVLVLAFSSLACGLLDFGLEPTQTTTPPTVTPPTDMEKTQIAAGENQGADTVPTANPNTQYWKYVEDPRFGVRLAVPCFWDVNIPTGEQDPTGMGSFSIQNFDEAYIARLGAKSGDAVWSYGGAKLDIGYLRPTDFNLAADASVEALAQAMYNNGDPNPEVFIESTEPVTYNGQQGLKVITYSQTWGDGQFYLFSIEPNLVLIVGLVQNAIGHPDTEAILSSLALSPDVEVKLPEVRPADPPIGMGAACLGVAESEIPTMPATTNSQSLTGTLDCNTVTPDDTLMWVACNVQDSIRSRNTQPLPGYMGSEFLMGFWLSEGITYDNPIEAVTAMEQWFPLDPGQMAFTMDETKFPNLFGVAPTDMLDPAVNVVATIYSEGWGQSGQGAAILFLAQDGNGRIYFYGMILAQDHFVEP